LGARIGPLAFFTCLNIYFKELEMAACVAQTKAPLASQPRLSNVRALAAKKVTVSDTLSTILAFNHLVLNKMSFCNIT
jgi:hypothetical protein